MYKRILLAVDDSDTFFETGYFDPHELVNKLVSHGRSQGVGGGHSPSRRSRYPLQCATRPGPDRLDDRQRSQHLENMTVLETHCRRGVRRLLMGSVSEGVLAQTARPVLLVRSEIEG